MEPNGLWRMDLAAWTKSSSTGNLDANMINLIKFKKTGTNVYSSPRGYKEGQFEFKLLPLNLYFETF